jgi:NADPH-dependent curcumin reductase CurA
MIAHEVRLRTLPRGKPSADDFSVVATPLSEPAEGQILIRNLAMSVDPYMRLPLTGLAGVHAPMKPGDVMDGAAVGVVVQSRHPAFAEGANVVHPQMGWREAYISDGTGLSRVDPTIAPLTYYLGILGLTGITAYGGVEYALAPRRDDIVFVSGAAGAVGMVVCQLAKRRHCRLIGSTGSDSKARWLRDVLKLDHVIDYRREDIGDALRAAAPDGLNGYFDNVGGTTLEGAIGAMKRHGRIALCGAIAQYNDANYRSGPGNFFTVIEKGLTLIGVNVGHYYDRGPQIIAELASLLKSGELIWQETVVDGLENAPAAFVRMLEGGNTGKMIVRLATA